MTPSAAHDLAYLAAAQKVIDAARAWRGDPPTGRDVRDLVCDLRDAVVGRLKI